MFLPYFTLLSMLMPLSALAAPHTLNITAISAANGQSIFECWQMDAPFLKSSAPGTDGAVFAQLGDTANATFAVLPPKFNGGLHNAPCVQYVAFVSGHAHITLPNATDKAIVHGGKRGLILAADIANVSRYGHITTYPSNESTISINVPTAHGEVPPHKCLYRGPCKGQEIASL